jgi:biopolymer transport protein ExbD
MTNSSTKRRLLSRTSSLLVFAFALAAVWCEAGAIKVNAQTDDPLFTTPTALIVAVDARGQISLNERPLGSTADTGALTARLRAIFDARKRNLVFADRDGATQTKIPLDDRIAKRVYVHPDMAVPLAKVLQLLRDLRDAGAHPISLDLNRGDVSYSAFAGPSVLLDPINGIADPRSLVIRMDAGRGLRLNADPVASLDALRQRLNAVFQQRTTNHDLDPATGSITRRVGLEFDPQLSLNDVLDTMVAISSTYPNPLILSLDPVDAGSSKVPAPAKSAKPKRRHSRRP